MYGGVVAYFVFVQFSNDIIENVDVLTSSFNDSCEDNSVSFLIVTKEW